jgi:hypothetical protein
MLSLRIEHWQFPVTSTNRKIRSKVAKRISLVASKASTRKRTEFRSSKKGLSNAFVVTINRICCQSKSGRTPRLAEEIIEAKAKRDIAAAQAACKSGGCCRVDK